MNKTFAAISIFIGMIIGAGILGLPYVFMQSGAFVGLVHLLVLGAILLITNLYLGEIALRTKKPHQLAGYANKYLGKKGKIIMFIAFAFGVYSALLAYLIGEAESLSYLIFGHAGHSFALGILFWIVLSLMSYHGLRSLEKGESAGFILILVLVLSIAILAWNKIDPANLTYIVQENIFVPFGVVLFSLMGFAALPEIERILDKQKKSLKKTVITSYILVILIYAIFALIVLGFQGTDTPGIATIALGKPFIILGMITMFTSYLGLSVALVDTFRLDLKVEKKLSWAYTCLIPIILFLILEFYALANFTKVLGIGGAISGSLTAILILFMVKKAKAQGDRTPEYKMPYSSILTWTLIIIFALGALIEIINAF